MAKCSICGKGVVFGQSVSHSHRKTNRTWKPNIRKVRAVVDGTPKTVAVCSRCLRSGKVTVAYRRLSRPSSALSAKAFTLRSFSLEQPFRLFS